MFSADCCKGIQDTGTPTGNVKTIDGIDCYVAKGSNAKAIILCTDVFGFKILNPRLMADELAKQTECTVYVPDYFNGNELPDSVFQTMMEFKTMNLFRKIWMGMGVSGSFLWFLWKNNMNNCCQIVKRLISCLRSKGTSNIGLLGFCWGGKIVLTLAGNDSLDSIYTKLVDGIVTCHPGGFHFAPKFPKICQDVAIPCQYILAEHDNELKEPQVAKIREIAASKTDCTVEWYPETTHGFAIRGDSHIPVVKKSRDDAFEKTVNFFNKHVKSML